MWPSRYICIFILYSWMGWIYETIYCTIKSGKWENRGFLYGPVCPIYGAGTVIILLVVQITRQRSIPLDSWQVFVISVLGSAVLEYATSYTLEKLFHARWWDYSGLPCNIHGRISLFTSLGFGGAGLLIVYQIAPYTELLMDRLTPLSAELLALLFTSLLVMDLTLTVTALLHFDRVVIRMDDAFNQNMQAIVGSAVQKTADMKQEMNARQKALIVRWNLTSSLFKLAIRRVQGFRYEDDRARASLNRLMPFLKKNRKSKR